jgi:hypothetical protein
MAQPNKRLQLLSFLALFPVALLAAQQQGSSPDATQWRGAIGLSIGIPGGFGAQAEVKLLRPVWARGVVRGMWGTLPRGVGIGLQPIDRPDLRAYVTATIGTIACYGDRDGVCSGKPTAASQAWSAGLGFEFPVAWAWGAGVEAERWFTVDGEQPSLWAAVFLLRVHF